MPIEPTSNAANPPWHAQLDHELRYNILPWWCTQMQDPAGGRIGGRANNGELRNELPRCSVLGSRLLWTFAKAARLPQPPPQALKAEPWDCPYHHARACLELMSRLDQPAWAAR